MSTRAARLILAVAAAAVLSGGGCTRKGATKPPPSPRPAIGPVVPQQAPYEFKGAYLRLGITPRDTVYVEFRDNRMRLATSPEGLAQARAVRAEGSSEGFAHFPATPLPAAGQAPGGWSKMELAVYALTSAGEERPKPGARPQYAGGTLNAWREDSSGAWTYALNIGTETGASPDAAPLLKLPQDGKITLEIVSKPAQGREVGIGLRLKAGDLEVEDILKNGKKVQAAMSLQDAAGRAAATARGPLEKFGFG